MIRPKEYLKDIYRTPTDRRKREEFLRLDKNEDPLGLPVEFIEKILKDVNPSFLSSYPQVYQLYDALGKYLGIPDDRIIPTSGSDAAIKSVFEVFVDPGDEIILLNPTYAMFNVYGELFRARVHKVDYSRELTIDGDEIINLISPRTKLIAIPNPNSPTGTVVDRGDLIRIIESANDIGALVLLDEAYYPFYNQTTIDLIEKFDNLVVTRTFSKAFRLASVRLGFLAAHPDTVRLLRSFKPMYEINAFAVLFGCKILENIQLMEQFVAEVEKGRKFVEKESKRLGLEPHKSHGNFILIKVGKEKVEPLVKKMEEKGILIAGGFGHPSLEDCIRLSLASPEQMEKPMDIIRKFMEDIKK